MKNNSRRRAAFEEPSYWQSFSDMMAALLLIFILIIAITLMIYRQKTTDLDLTRQELNTAQIELDQYRKELEASNKELADSLAELQIAYDDATKTQRELDDAYAEIELAMKELEDANANMQLTRDELEATRNELQDIVGIRTDIIGELQSRFNNSNMKVDAQTGSITFSSDVLFEFGSAELTKDSKAALQEAIPMYLGVLLQEEYRSYIAEIIIEGHTDTKGSFESNMDLSYNRANAVANFCMASGNGLSAQQITRLQRLMTVNGRSYSSPVYVKGTMEVDMDASRRVEIKFRLKEDEMISRIADILEQETDVSEQKPAAEVIKTRP